MLYILSSKVSYYMNSKLITVLITTMFGRNPPKTYWLLQDDWCLGQCN